MRSLDDSFLGKLPGLAGDALEVLRVSLRGFRLLKISARHKVSMKCSSSGWHNRMMVWRVSASWRSKEGEKAKDRESKQRAKALCPVLSRLILVHPTGDCPNQTRLQGLTTLRTVPFQCILSTLFFT